MVEMYLMKKVLANLLEQKTTERYILLKRGVEL